MSSHATSAIELEWSTLQHNHEQYERGLLWIKLLAVVLAAIAFVSGNFAHFMALLIAVLWAQEAIFRTFQNRLSERILRIEALIREGGEGASACQLHSEWAAARPGTAGLLAEYARSALRPTVAFPHAVLILGLIGMWLAA
ncbi:hypothetical protein [Cognatazoarcus halotolerans]|uniref:hypothetical protein n=1 Tax=Cognatazoarcus halotolerans TaxID=2686016 RepID=UPI0013582BC2|nr:hypothetical protein [Cognatazoarcus halotolerans]MBX3679559.1 hypothetical protein [Rhodocyclaceae bacterium]MCB1897717.1 hypothetical protein [Rhodocyclaceae bacterium]MCP5310711.1 hypothetical protein [Zoogloeaceae bacterium]